MSIRYVKISEVIEQLHIGTEFLRALEAEDLIHMKSSSEGDLVISADDIERVRVALLLTDELDVNLPGVEVIVHMRDSMLAMQRQFSEVLNALVEELRRQLHAEKPEG
jgi:MerR family transcriptional regulator/heat shock protein HspR